jgi:hypothetical protein
LHSPYFGTLRLSVRSTSPPNAAQGHLERVRTDHPWGSTWSVGRAVLTAEVENSWLVPRVTHTLRPWAHRRFCCRAPRPRLEAVAMGLHGEISDAITRVARALNVPRTCSASWTPSSRCPGLDARDRPGRSLGGPQKEPSRRRQSPATWCTSWTSCSTGRGTLPARHRGRAGRDRGTALEGDPVATVPER